MFKRYPLEVISLLLLVFAAGITYGILEADFINTDTGNFRAIPWTGGHFAYYHLCLLSLMAIASFALAVCHFQWIVEHRGKYLLLMGVAALPLSLMVEDITWFLTRWQPIHKTEWTVIPAGWAINLGFSYVPLWYIGVLIFSSSLLLLASHYATIGRKKVLDKL